MEVKKLQEANDLEQWKNIGLIPHTDVSYDHMLYLKTDDYWKIQLFTGRFEDYSHLIHEMRNTKIIQEAERDQDISEYFPNMPDSFRLFQTLNRKKVAVLFKIYKQLVGRGNTMYTTYKDKYGSSFRSLNSWRCNIYCAREQYWFTGRPVPK
jgi:hypothetical protein